MRPTRRDTHRRRARRQTSTDGRRGIIGAFFYGESAVRLPAAGTTPTRTYKGRELKVSVLEDGFRFEGEEYRSLSAPAMKVTGYTAINAEWRGSG